MKKPIVVVGAGLGGLAVAARLAYRGERVVVLEQTDQVGGRNRPVQVNDCHFDGGPTLMMMLEPFQTLFKDLGERLEDHLEISLCDPSYRTFFRDGTRLDATPNIAKMLRQIEEIGAVEDVANYPRLIGDLGRLYHESVPTFVRNDFSRPWTYLNPTALITVARHGMLGNLARRMRRYVKDERLNMLFTFQSMYLGLSPFDAPWVYSTLTYMEYGDGIWYPKGGVPKISEAIAKLAIEHGAEIRLGAKVTRVEGSRVELESGEVIEAKTIIANSDLPAFKREVLREEPKKKLRYSCSAYVLYFDYEGSLPDLLHHNVFFGKDFRGNLDAIFKHRARPDDPAFYACLSNRSDPERAPKGRENLFLLIPCANLDRPWSDEEGQALEQLVFNRLKEEVGFDPAKIRGKSSTTPEDWNRQLGLERGAAFGLSHDLFQSAFFRASNKSKRDGIYYVGASTVPGNGMPMVLISAELCEARMARDGVIR